MCFFLGAVQDTMAFITVHWLGIRVAPLFDQPWVVRPACPCWVSADSMAAFRQLLDAFLKLPGGFLGIPA
jgi:hypothetical protein